MKRHCFSFTRAAVFCCLSLGFVACSHHHSTPPPGIDTGPRNSPEQGMEILSDNPKTKRDAWKDKTFEEFKSQVYQEPFESGKYIVNGDTAIVDEKHLQEFFETRMGLLKNEAWAIPRSNFLIPQILEGL